MYSYVAGEMNGGADTGRFNRTGKGLASVFSGPDNEIK